MSSVSEMVASKIAEAPAGKAGSTPKKMIVYITEENSALLGALGRITATGKIDLASELLAISIADAHKACVKANKMTEDGKVVGEKAKDAKPQAPPAPPAPGNGQGQAAGK